MSDPSAPMELFLGYDPGGEDKHGVVSVKIARDGTYSDLEADRLGDATEVCAWLSKHPTAVALGIDTLLAWSSSGRRPCDDLLRERYNDSKSITVIGVKGCVHCKNVLTELRRVQAKPEWRNSKSVVSQNSLYSAMTLNGALVAMAAREGRPEFPVVESHPKLLLHAAERILGPAQDHLVEGYSELLHRGEPHKTGKDRIEVHEDHMADAFVAAWCTSRWYFKQWTTDLYHLTPSEDYYFPAGRAVYPWPEPVGAS